MKNSLALLLFFIIGPLLIQNTDAADERKTYERDTIFREAERFFGEGAEGLADVIAQVFEDQGRPNGYIKGEEVGGAIGIGVRYGSGTLVLKDGPTRQVYWRGPSIGIDLGANVVKVFVLVYDLPDIDSVYRRYPGVDGSLYFVAGVGVNYVRSGDIVLAPIRFGVGWRQGASVGYMRVTREQSMIPF